MNKFQQLLGFATLLLLGALLGSGGYESVVMAPNYQADIPHSLEHARLFMRVANPGNFFRVVAPATQLALLLCVVAFWSRRGARWWYVAALVALLSADVVTYTFHYPRNYLLFHSPMTEDPARLTVAAREWATGNVWRLVLILTSAITACLGLRAALLEKREGNGS